MPRYGFDACEAHPCVQVQPADEIFEEVAGPVGNRGGRWLEVSHMELSLVERGFVIV